ncbi:MAG: dihydrofolate reductase [Muriicola sp.]|nr:dihydrofolate reductase [Muriicola sp.]
MIAAAAENNALGKDNQLLWHLPDDFKRFKAMTTGHSIIMGRKTFESFPKPLPNRFHIIITRDRSYTTEHDACRVVHSLKDALSLVENDKEAYIIGGGEIYTQALPFVDVIELTRVHQKYEADTFFPEIDKKKWELLKEEFHPSDEKHKVSFSYLTYERH